MENRPSTKRWKAWTERSVMLQLFLVLASPTEAQLVLNEACSKNNSVLEDPFGRYPDWIEVLNTGNTVALLDQFFLSDKFSQLDKWQLPDVELSPGEHVVFFAGDGTLGDHYFPFKLSQEGETVYLSNSGLDVIAQLEIPFLHADHSYGRSNGALRFFDVPTPGLANVGPAYLGYSPLPVPSHVPGYQTGAIDLDLSTNSGFTIHATMDGRDPGPGDPVVDAPLEIGNTTVVKAIATGPDHLPSEQFVGTYALDPMGALPMVSISTHPDSLWDWERGIYVMGPDADTIFPYRGANFWRGNHIPAHFEFYDEQGQLGLTQRVDLRIQGGSQARTKPQRPLRVTARKRYGDGELAYPFFLERGSLDRYKHLVLRNSSGDFCLANFRDGLWHQLALHQGLDVDVLGFKPTRLYLNGEYWGLMNLRERISTQHLALNYGADKDLVLLMDKENTSVQGDTIHFHALKEYIYQQDLNDPSHWAHVEEQLDIASYKDYFALEIFAGNADWPANNIRYWKPSVEEGKWRYLLHDLDATTNVYGWISMDIDMFWEILVHRAGWTHSEVFRNLLKNDEFRRTFINRLADLMNTAFTEQQLLKEIGSIRSTISGEVEKHFNKWEYNVDDWYLHAHELIPEFARVRPVHVREQVLRTFQLSNVVELEFSVFPEGAGSITLNTIQPDLPFQGHYFNGNAIDLSVHPTDGAVFDHWEYITDRTERFTGSSIQEEFGQNGKLIAFFRTTGKDLLVFPNPFNDEVTLSYTAAEAGSASVIINDVSGREVHRSFAIIGEGVNSMRIDLANLAVGTYAVTVRTEKEAVTERLVKGS